jgi:hypothetical protein
VDLMAPINRVWKFAFLIVAAVGCAGEELPSDLIGTWMATSPRHEGRFLEISKEHIVFSANEINSTYYTLRGVESTEVEDAVLYTLEYLGVGGASRKLVVRFSDAGPVGIELKNQDGIWIRKDPIASKGKESI